MVQRLKLTLSSLPPGTWGSLKSSLGSDGHLSFRDKNLRDAAEELVGQEIGQKLDDVWGVDDEGEVKGTWRFTGRRSTDSRFREYEHLTMNFSRSSIHYHGW